MQDMFSATEREAIVSLMIEMANADGDVAYEELIRVNHINDLMGISEEEFFVARALKAEYACGVVSRMDAARKRLVGKLLQEMIDADEKIDEREIILLERIGKLTGIDLCFD